MSVILIFFLFFPSSDFRSRTLGTCCSASGPRSTTGEYLGSVCCRYFKPTKTVPIREILIFLIMIIIKNLNIFNVSNYDEIFFNKSVMS